MVKIGEYLLALLQYGYLLYQSLHTFFYTNITIVIVLVFSKGLLLLFKKVKLIVRMKRVLFSIAAIALIANVNAQNLNKVKDALEEKNLMVAKQEIDGLMAKPEYTAKPDVWFWKGMVENELSKDDKTRTSCADCKLEAVQSFKRYLELDKKGVLMVTRLGAPMYELYNGFLEEGNKAYTTENIAMAYDQFNKALELHDYIGTVKLLEREGINFAAMDTMLISNVAICAMNSNKNLEAIALYSKLIDTKAATENMANNCGVLVSNTFISNKKKEAQDFNNKCKNYFANNETFYETEMQMMEDADRKVVMAKYDEAIKAKPNAYRIHFNYLAEMFNYIHAGKPLSADEKLAMQTRFDALAQATNAINHTADVDALLCKNYYNVALDYNEQSLKIKGTDKESIKQKEALTAKQNGYVEKCIQAGLSAEKLFTASPTMAEADKENYKSILPVLKSIFAFKNDAAKAAAYKKKVEEFK